MIKLLSIRNLLLIDKIDLSLDRGLCVLTGETGAGKSMILDYKQNKVDFKLPEYCGV